MFALDIILKKRNGFKLTREEIEYFIKGFTVDEIPDYQAAAFLMAVYFQKMDEDETLWLTEAMLHSGDVIDLSSISGVKVDKHSTGGVGDKTTLVIAPVVASCGIPVAKMSGRGLGYTGGTIDKLESIPGFLTSLSKDEFFSNVKEIGLAVVGQTGNLAPADKKLYALRDVTGTVDNISLIASSIMSKKLASGADAIVLDVKTGSGAFMKTPKDAGILARAMVNIGKGAGRRIVAIITEMDRPLGLNIGNALEVIEAVDVLKGGGPSDLKEVCIELAANMLTLANTGSLNECRDLAHNAIVSGAAYEKFLEMVKKQGGDPATIENTSKLPQAVIKVEWKAEKSGYIQKIQAEKLGLASLLAGAGRKTKTDVIDPSAGIVLCRKPGDKIQKGDPIAVLHASKEGCVPEVIKVLNDSVSMGENPPEMRPVIIGRVE